MFFTLWACFNSSLIMTIITATITVITDYFGHNHQCDFLRSRQFCSVLPISWVRTFSWSPFGWWKEPGGGSGEESKKTTTCSWHLKGINGHDNIIKGISDFMRSTSPLQALDALRLLPQRFGFMLTSAAPSSRCSEAGRQMLVWLRRLWWTEMVEQLWSLQETTDQRGIKPLEQRRSGWVQIHPVPECWGIRRENRQMKWCPHHAWCLLDQPGG